MKMNIKCPQLTINWSSLQNITAVG